MKHKKPFAITLPLLAAFGASSTFAQTDATAQKAPTPGAAASAPAPAPGELPSQMVVVNGIKDRKSVV